MRQRYYILFTPIMALMFLLMGNASMPQATAVVIQTETAKEIFVKESQSLMVSATVAVPEASRDGFGITELSVVGWPATSTSYSDGFGWRSCAGCSSDHKGVDFTPGGGTTAMAASAGVVIQAGYNGSLGNCVTIQHVIDGQNVTTVYGHMQDGSLTVNVGDSVSVGQVIGLVGSTGQSTGNHLHFEVHIDDVPIDPLPWLDAHVNVGAWDWLLNQ